MIAASSDFGMQVSIYNPWTCPAAVLNEYGLRTIPQVQKTTFDTLVLDVVDLVGAIDFTSLQKTTRVLYDVKGILGTKEDGKL